MVIMSPRVFLGGTCNDSNWRDKLIPMLQVPAFNPVVKDWTPECQQEELFQRKQCDICLYVITPRMIGTYSIAEVVDDSNKRPERTVFCMLREDFSEEEYKCFNDKEWKSLSAVWSLVHSNGVKVFSTLEDVASYLNEVLQ